MNLFCLLDTLVHFYQTDIHSNSSNQKLAYNTLRNSYYRHWPEVFCKRPDHGELDENTLRRFCCLDLVTDYKFRQQTWWWRADSLSPNA